MFEWHADTFDLPEQAVRLARSPRYENQAFRIGPVAYAIQCHLETTIDDVRDWFAAWPSLVEIFEARYGPGSLDSFLEEYAASMPDLRQTARQLFRRWLENAFVHCRPTRPPAFRASSPGDESLLGRESEQMRIAHVLEAAREGRSGALVLAGETGIGKTALLDDAAARAQGMRVLRLAGIESQLEHPLAGFEALCRPLLDRLASLPQRQARALAGALGIGRPARGERFDSYAGALSLLAAAAEREPLLVCVDDAHLLDDASLEALGFIVDRIEAEGIALLIASAAASVLEAPEVEVVELGPLDRGSAWLLLERRFGSELSPHVAAEVIDAARGNPLALLEIPASLSSDQRSGAAPLADLLRTRTSAEHALLARISALPDETRRALLVAALSETDDLRAVERALQAAGLDASALARAAQEGLVEIAGGRVAFRHNLVRSTVIYGALRSERRRAHAALAEASDAGLEAQAWHRALAAAGPDEAIAASLTEVAARAGMRGAPAAAARAYELAARLSPATQVRAQRLLRAAEAASLAGHIFAAVDHLEAALPQLEDADERLSAERLLGRVLARSGSAGRARDVLLAAAGRGEVRDRVQAASLLADAVIPALRAGGPGEAREIARRALVLTEGTGGLPELTAALMLGTAHIYTGDFSSGRELVLRAAALAADQDAFDREPQLRVYLGAGLRLAGERDRAREVLAKLVDDARAEGLVGVLAYALVRLGEVELDAGRWPSARALLVDASRLARETGQGADRGLAAGGLAWLAAVQGRREECEERAAEAIELAERLGVGSRLNRAIHARGLLALANGKAEEAVHHLSEMRQLQLEQGWCDATIQPHGAPDLVEALVAAGDLDLARRELAVLEEETRRAGRPSAVAGTLRSRGLLARRDEAWALFDEALRVDEELTGPFERARTELAYGERLAEEAMEARAEGMLGAALEQFVALGAEPWAERTRETIRRLGAQVPEPEQEVLSRLTDRELQVVVAVSSGESVGDAAVRLLLTVPTVERNLATALSKLELSSPGELSGVVTGPPARALA